MTNQIGHLSLQKQLHAIAEEVHSLSDHLMIAKKGRWEICHLSEDKIQTWIVEGKALCTKYVQTLAQVILASTTKKEEGNPGRLLGHLNSDQGPVPLYVHALSLKQFKALDQHLCTLTCQTLIDPCQLQIILAKRKMIEIEGLFNRSTAQEALINEAFERTSLDSWEILKFFFLSIDQKCYRLAQYLLKTYQGPKAEELRLYLRDAILSKDNSAFDEYFDPSFPQAMVKAIKLFGDHHSFLLTLIQAGINPHDHDVYQEIGRNPNLALIEFWGKLCSEEQKKSFACEVFKSLAYFSPHGEREEVERQTAQFTLVLDYLMPFLDLNFEEEIQNKWLDQIARALSPLSIKKKLFERILQANPS